MVNEGAKILDEGIALRASDIDVVWINGYGFPVAKGGPMHWAEAEGLSKIVARLDHWHGRTGNPVFDAGAAVAGARPSPASGRGVHDAASVCMGSVLSAGPALGCADRDQHGSGRCWTRPPTPAPTGRCCGSATGR